MANSKRSATSATTSTPPRTASIAPFSGVRDFDADLGAGGEGASSSADNPADRLAKIVDVFRGQDDDDAGAGDNADDTPAGDDAPGDDDDQEAGQELPKTLEAVAEALGVEVADLYAIEFKPKEKGAQARTLGDLKDLLAKETDYERREIAFEERRTVVENELMRARQDLTFMLSQMPKGSITPELEKRATAERERVARIEGERVLDAVPEWADEERRKADYAAMSGFMSEYGYRAGELERIVDHRALKMIRDAWRRAERIKKALEQTQEVKPAAAKGPAKSGQPKERKGKPAAVRHASEKVAAIGQLLIGGK